MKSLRTVGRYVKRREFFVCPCDGRFSRDVQKALVFAIQYEIGMSDNVANGRFGPGTRDGIRTQAAALLAGDVATVLVHVIRRFHYEVEEVARHELAGHRPATGLAGHTTNYASGTAVAIRPDAYPPGATGVLFPQQVAVVRDILKEWGVVSWGGRLRRPHAAHFQIAVRPGDPRLRRLALRIDGWTQAPGRGAGLFPLGA